MGNRRNRTPVKLCTHVDMPIFTEPDSVDITWQRYSLSAAIIPSGHYQTVTFWNGQAWMHDDGQKLKKLRTLSEVEANCYLVCLTYAQM